MSEQTPTLTADIGWLGGNTTPDHTLGDVVDRTGLDRHLVREIWRVLGRPVAEDERPAFTDADLDLLQHAAAVLAPAPGQPAADEAGLLRTLRAAAPAIRRITDAHATACAEHLHDGPEAAIEHLDRHASAFEDLLVAIWRHQLRQSLANTFMSTADPLNPTLAVGFVDLAGYSARSQQLPTDRLIELLERFDRASTEACARHGGTIIKTIGDEVMFTHTEPSGGARIALDVVARCRTDELLGSARAGVTWGTPLAWAGDYYGPTVNLAARLVQLARPGTVLADDAMATALALDPSFDVRALTPQRLRGLGRCGVNAITEATH